MADVIGIGTVYQQNKHGLFSLAKLPQRRPVSEIAMSTGWWELDQIWKLYAGQFTIITGIPAHGKSTFVLNVVCNVACEHGMHSFLYMPENEQHLSHKLQTIWGDRDGFDEFAEKQCFVQSAMPERHTDEPKDLVWVLDQAVAAINSYRIDLLVIDPWNELEFAKRQDVPMTEYIRQCLLYLKQFCRVHNVAVVLVAHPTKAVAEHGGRTPLLSDIEGSMSWYNKCDNGLIIVRDFEKKTSRVVSAKVRENGAGKVGVCHFFVDEDTGLFTPQIGAVTP